MTRRIRFIILCLCAVAFFLITPFIVLYSLGYRVDFEKKKIVATGGIYVKALPPGAIITIDSEAANSTGFFSNSVFVQNLLPAEHKVSITKEGYFDYQKNLLVKENEVTKLEHVVLFKKNTAFEVFESAVDTFSLAPDQKTLLVVKTEAGKIKIEKIDLASLQKKLFSLPIRPGSIQQIQWSNDSKRALLKTVPAYFLLDFTSQPTAVPLPYLNGAQQISFDSQNADQLFYLKNQSLYSNQQTLPIVNNVAAYSMVNQTIVWLSRDGFLYQANSDGKSKRAITSTVFPVKSRSSYEVTIANGATFLKEDQSLFLLNQDTRMFEKFYAPAKALKVSPDNQKILSCNDHEIVFSFLNTAQKENILLNRFSEPVDNCQWLNDDYVIFTVGNKIMISEIDHRDAVNAVTLSLDNPQPNNLEERTIFFNQQDKKLYLLNQHSLLLSEKLTP